MAGVVGVAGSAAGSLQPFPTAHLQEVVEEIGERCKGKAAT